MTTLSQSTIFEILRDACQAPSGDNTQPWRFEVRENTIHIINESDKDTSLFNWRQVTNHVALGACIENLRISAEHRGFSVALKFFPDAQNRLIVAEAVLTSGVVQNDLAPYIAQRATNRKRYHNRQIESEKLAELSMLAKDIGGRVAFVSDKDGVRRIAHTVSTGEKLALENKSIHDFLFSHITWTKEEDEKKHGFFIDTFEFNFLQKTMFRLFRNWNILKFFLSLGVSRLIVRDIRNIHLTSATFGAIVIPNDTDEDYLRAGMLLERLWLTASKLGLSLQPTTIVHFVGAQVLAGDSEDITQKHQQLLRGEYTRLTEAFSLNKSENFGFVFRLGYADNPTAMTTRFEPEISFED